MQQPLIYLYEALFLHTIWGFEDGECDVYEPIKAHVASNGLAYYYWEPIGHYVIIHQDTGDCAIPHTIAIATPELCQQIIAGMDSIANWHGDIERIQKTKGTRAAIEKVLRGVGIALPGGLYGTEEANACLSEH